MMLNFKKYQIMHNNWKLFYKTDKNQTEFINENVSEPLG